MRNWSVQSYKILSQISREKIAINKNRSLGAHELIETLNEEFVRKHFSSNFFRLVVQESLELHEIFESGVFFEVQQKERTKDNFCVDYCSTDKMIMLSVKFVRIDNAIRLIFEVKLSARKRELDLEDEVCFPNFVNQVVYFKVNVEGDRNSIDFNYVWVDFGYRGNHIAKRLKYFFLKTLEQEGLIVDSTQVQSKPVHIASYKFLFPNSKNPVKEMIKAGDKFVCVNACDLIQAYDPQLESDWLNLK